MSEQSLLLSRAKSAVIARDFSLAIKLYRQLLRENPKDVSLLKQLGDIYMKSGKDNEALPIFKRIIEIDRRDIKSIIVMGGIYRRLKDYDQSIAVLEQALVIDGNNSEISYNLGFTYKAMGNLDAAISCFEDAVEENPNDVLAFNHLGSIYAQKGEIEKSIQSYLRGLKVDPNHPILQLNIAKSYEAKGEYDKAVTSYNGALKAKPLWIEAIDNYSHLLIKINKIREAYELINSALKAEPKDIKMHTALGNVYSRQSVYDDAEKEYRLALTEDECYSPALTGLANSLEEQGKNEEALQIISKAEELNPEDKETKKQSVHILLSANYLKQAQKELLKLYKTDKQEPDILNLIGQYYICKGDWKRADIAFKRIEKVCPSYDEYYYDCGKRFKQKGDYANAEKYLKKAIELNSSDSSALVVLASMYENKGLLDEAYKLYSFAVNSDPNNKFAEKSYNRLHEHLSKSVSVANNEPFTEEELSNLVSNADFEGVGAEISMEPTDESFDEFDQEFLTEQEDKQEDEDFDFAQFGMSELSKEEPINPVLLEESEIILSENETEPEEIALDSLINKEPPFDFENFSAEPETNNESSQSETKDFLDDFEDLETLETLEDLDGFDNLLEESELIPEDKTEVTEKESDDLQTEKLNLAIEKANLAADKALYAAEKLEDLEDSFEINEELIESKESDKEDEVENLFEEDEVPEVSKILAQDEDNEPFELDEFEENDVYTNEIAEDYIEYLTLFKTLRQLLNYLPSEKLNEFLTSKTRLLLDYIISKLSYEPGLYASAKALIDSGAVKSSNVTEEQLEGFELSKKVLNDINELTNSIPDEHLQQAMKNLLSKLN